MSNYRESVNKTHFKTMVKEHRKLARMSRLAHHLGVSMSLLSDVSVRTTIRTQELAVPAATRQRHANPYVGSNYGGKGYITGRWGSGAKYVAKRSYYTAFESTLLPEDDLGVWLGIAWHELGHVLWSPFGANIQFTIGLNLLEDARIETLMMQKYPRTKGAILKALSYVLGLCDTVTKSSNRGQKNFAYARVAGRTYLSQDIRDEFRRLCSKRDADEIDRIYREYLDMSDQMIVSKASKLADQLNALIGGSVGLPQHTCDPRSSGMNPEAEDDDTSINPDTVQQVGGTASEDDEKPSDKDGAEPSDTQAGSGGSPSNDEPTVDQQRGQLTKAIKEAFDDLDKELTKAAGEDDTLQKEVAKIKSYLDGAGGNYLTKQGSNKVLTPTPDAIKLAQDIKRKASKFNDESGKGLVRKRDSGRIKPNRYERTGDIDTAYDMWEPGLDQEMHIALLIDISGSMAHSPLSEVLYALEVGLGDVATVEPVLWHDTFEIPATANTPQRMVLVQTMGGTDPSDALSYIHPRLIGSPSANKLLVLYSDGGFNETANYHTAAAYLDDLMSRGVNVRLVGERGQNFSRVISKSTLVRGSQVSNVVGLEDLPKIVDAWTRTVLMKGTL